MLLKRESFPCLLFIIYLGKMAKCSILSLCLSVFKIINSFPSLLQMSLSHGDFFYYLYNLWIINNLNAQSLSCVWLFATPWTVARQAPLSMGLSWQEYWSGLPFPPPGDLSDPGNESSSPTIPALIGGFSITKPPGKPISCCHYSLLYPSCVHFGQVSTLVLLTCPY